MSVQEIPDSVWKHRGDLEWLEVNGRAALEEYVAQHDDPRDRFYARQTFTMGMFIHPRTRLVYGSAPKWFWEEYHAQFEQLKRDLAEFNPIFKNAWGGPRRTDNGESKAVTIIETRRR